jgi:hypothetical protein
MADQSWDERFAAFLERVMATAVSGGDPKPLQEEYARLLKEAPPGKKKALKLTEKRPDGKPTKQPTPTR